MAMTAKDKRDARAEAKRLRDQQAEETGATQRQESAVQATQKLNEAAFAAPGGLSGAEILKPSKSGATVVVACKLGVVSYSIQLSKMEQKFEQNMQGGRMVTEATRIGPVVILRGTAYPRGTPPEGFPSPPLMVGGAALNYGVSKDFWDEWKEQHKLDPLVVNGFIFAHESQDHVLGRAKEEAGKKSGLEPVDPKNMKDDPRVPKSTRGEVENVEAGVRPKVA